MKEFHSLSGTKLYKASIIVIIGIMMTGLLLY